MDRSAHGLVVAFMLSFMAGAQAQVFKCMNGGQVVFSDKPCEQTAQTVKLALPAAASASASASIDFDVLTRHYAVNGANLMAAYRSMRASSPDGFAGWARWKVDYDFTTSMDASRCRISTLRIKVTGDILMPEWKQESAASLNDQAGWRTMYTNLKRHEDGHVQHGREFGVLLRERLLGLGAAACSDIQSLARQEMDRLYANLIHRDKEYDRRTDHGLRQDNPR